MNATYTAPQNITRESFYFDVLDLGCVDYARCFSLQQSLVEDIRFGKKKSVLLLCEHPPVITLGRQAKKENILHPVDKLMAQGVDVVQVNRGGDVTLHLPGQLVVYPVFDLKLVGKDIRVFLRNLEQAIIALLKGLGIEALRKGGLTGVWVGERKIASIGIALSHWVAYHGVSVNVNCNLGLFSLILPCGQDIMMTSIATERPQAPLEMSVVKENMVKAFREVFR